MIHASAMSPGQRWYWNENGKQIKARYYARLTSTAAGRARLAQQSRSYYATRTPDQIEREQRTKAAKYQRNKHHERHL